MERSAAHYSPRVIPKSHLCQFVSIRGFNPLERRPDRAADCTPAPRELSTRTHPRAPIHAHPSTVTIAQTFQTTLLHHQHACSRAAYYPSVPFISHQFQPRDASLAAGKFIRLDAEALEQHGEDVCGRRA